MLEDLPLEVFQRIVYYTHLTPHTLVNLSLTSKHVYAKVFGELGSENHFDVDQHRALAGALACARSGWWRASRLALRRGYGGGPDDDVNVLALAIQGGETAFAEELVRRGMPSVTGQHSLPLRLAAAEGMTSVVRMLLENPGENPIVAANAPLMGAVAGSHREVVDMLLAIPSVAKENLLPAFTLACEKDDVGVVAALAAAIDARDDNRFVMTRYVVWNGMCEAVLGGHAEVLSFLVERDELGDSLDDLRMYRMHDCVAWACRKKRMGGVVAMLKDPRFKLVLEKVRVKPLISLIMETRDTEMIGVLLDYLMELPVAEDATKLEMTAYVLRMSVRTTGAPEIYEMVLTSELVSRSSPEKIKVIKQQLFFEVAFHGFPNMVQHLLKDPEIDPSADDDNALVAVCDVYSAPEDEQGTSCGFEYQTAKLLLSDPRVNPSAQSNLAFFHALTCNQVHILKLLLAHPRFDHQQLADSEHLQSTIKTASARCPAIAALFPTPDPSSSTE